MRRRTTTAEPSGGRPRRSVARILSAGAMAVALVTGGSALALPATAAAATSTHAGDGIIITTADGGESICTMNSVVERDGTFYGVTAGHCLNPEELGSQVVKVSTRDGRLLADSGDVQAGGVVRGGTANPFDPQAGLDDFGWFRLDESVTPDPGQVSSTADTGFPMLDDLLRGGNQPLGDPVPVSRNLVGSIVCKDGTMSGRTCGPVLAVNSDTEEITALIPAIGGDSGSPLHVSGRDGKRHVVGTLSNGTPVLFNTFDGTRQHLNRI
ncbi:hypothetical protein [Corynebacterium sp.]|uniref:hypothetical protein n=1 Tax=Corynebacterium sp. TaxID=1720 RepID=UPI0025B94D02|nr:hypothetical protein [Corynebacterium sp.]